MKIKQLSKVGKVQIDYLEEAQKYAIFLDFNRFDIPKEEFRKLKNYSICSEKLNMYHPFFEKTLEEKNILKSDLLDAIKKANNLFLFYFKPTIKLDYINSKLL